MKKQIGSLLAALIFFTLVGVVINGCQKTSSFTPPIQTMFVSSTSGTYQITAPGVVYKIPIGLTAVAATDKTINIAVSSSTGAQLGTQYTLSSSSITIPAGKVVDTLTIFGVYDQYTGGRKDSLTITLSGTDIESAGFNNTYTLLVSGPCFEGDIVLSELLGDYTETYDVLGGYGPYTTSITKAVSTGPTSATITISNIYDWGWNDLDFNLDWSDPSDPKLTFVTQGTGFDAGNLNSSVAGHEVWIEAPQVGTQGTYSYCNGTFTINYRLCMPTFGACFTNPEQTVLSR